MRRFLVVTLFVLAGCGGTETSGDKNGEPQGTGTIEGWIHFDDVMPKNPERDDAGMLRDLLQVDPDTKGLANVVVYLESVDGRALTASSDDESTEVLIEQIDFTFVPDVIAVRAGQTVRFTNEDGHNHNVRAMSDDDRSMFNVMTTGDHDYETTFELHPDGKPIYLTCDIHRWMRGWVYVFDHDFYQVTNESGRYSFEDLAPGNYTVVIEQPELGYRMVSEIVLPPGHTRIEKLKIPASYTK
ncbi:MAG: carboxypeptidase regulatory-like domain-containing protein [Candidatus Hydrogenedentota bacterium]